MRIALAGRPQLAARLWDRHRAWRLRLSVVLVLLAIGISPRRGGAQASTVTFENRSSAPATVKLVGPTTAMVEIPGMSSRTVSAAPGRYTFEARLGSDPRRATYSRGDPFQVTETGTSVESVTITLQSVAGGNYNVNPSSREAFEGVMAKAVSGVEASGGPPAMTPGGSTPAALGAPTAAPTPSSVAGIPVATSGAVLPTPSRGRDAPGARTRLPVAMVVNVDSLTQVLVTASDTGFERYASMVRDSLQHMIDGLQDAVRTYQKAQAKLTPAERQAAERQLMDQQATDQKLAAALQTEAMQREQARDRQRDAVQSLLRQVVVELRQSTGAVLFDRRGAILLADSAQVAQLAAARRGRPLTSPIFAPGGGCPGVSGAGGICAAADRSEEVAARVRTLLAASPPGDRR